MKIIFELIKLVKIPLVLASLVGLVYYLMPKDDVANLKEKLISSEQKRGEKITSKDRRSIASTIDENGNVKYIREKVYQSEQYISRSKKERSNGSSSQEPAFIDEQKRGRETASSGYATSSSSASESSAPAANNGYSAAPSSNQVQDTVSEAETTSQNNDSKVSDSGNETPSLSDGVGPTVTDTSSDDPEVTDTPTTPRTSTKTLNCTFDKSEGTYSEAIDIVLSCSETADIKFCIQAGGSCCSPLSSPSNFTDKVSISADGDYCLSFMGSVDSLDSSLVEARYKLDSTIPSLNVSASKRFIQTTEISSELSATSSDFGKDNYYYHQFNLYSHNPTAGGLNWNCKEIYNNYVGLSGPNPFVTNVDFSVSSLLPTDQINYVMKLDKLAYGKNYIATIVEDRHRSVMGCQTTPITLEDFGAYGFLGTTEQAETPGVGRSIASFTSFGHFETETPTLPSRKGEQESIQSDMKLEANFIKITH